MNESAINKVLTQYVIENANLKLVIEQQKEEIEELKSDNKEPELGSNEIKEVEEEC